MSRRKINVTKKNQCHEEKSMSRESSRSTLSKVRLFNRTWVIHDQNFKIFFTRRSLENDHSPEQFEIMRHRVKCAKQLQNQCDCARGRQKARERIPRPPAYLCLVHYEDRVFVHSALRGAPKKRSARGICRFCLRVNAALPVLIINRFKMS